MKRAALVLFLASIFSSINAQSKVDTAIVGQELKEFNRKLDSAITHKDSTLLDNLISKSFLRIHGTNGAVEERNSWIKGLLKAVQNSQGPKTLALINLYTSLLLQQRSSKLS